MNSRIFTFDVETAPHEALVWGMWQQNVAVSQLVKPTYMLTWAGKFYGDKQIISRTYLDPDFFTKLRECLNEADAVVGYNSDKFDLRHVRREFIENGYPPTRPVGTVDLIKTVKAQFNFPHNRLDYVCQRLIGDTKMETGGFELWREVMAGNPVALAKMLKYNKKDVTLTERLYTRLRPWIKNHPYTVGDAMIDDANHAYECATCGSRNVTLERPRRTRCFAIRQINCKTCGAWGDGKRSKIA